MKKAVSANGYMTWGALVAAIVLSAPAIAQERQQSSGAPFLTLQKQIDALNKCRQPVLIRHQTDLLREASDDEASLGAALGTSLVSRELQEAFLRSYLARGESPDEFWKSLEEDPMFTQDVLYELRLALFLGQLTDYRMPLLLQLRRYRQAERLITLRDISMVTRERWRELLTGSGTDLDPESFIRNVDATFDRFLFGGCK